jgi:hypothetical protein
MRTVSSCILAVVLVPTGATAQPTFTQFTTVGVGVAGSPRAIVTADFDGDGDLDFATANIRGLNPASATIALWTGPSSSGPARVTRIPLPEGPIALTTVDVLRDGSKDLAVVSADASRVTILRNDGLGTFTVGQQITTPSQPRDIVHGDFNRDGTDDLAFAVLGCDCIQVALQDREGFFSSELTEPVGLDPWGLAVADFDRDGILDLASANSGAHTVTVLYGSGNGRFGATDGNLSQRLDVRVGRGPRAVAIADVNRDGRLDFATANSSENEPGFSVVLATGDRVFAPAARYSVSGTPPRDVDFVDTNGDGKLDMVGAESTQNRLIVMHGRGNGCFAATTEGTGCGGYQFFAAPPGARNIAYGDINGDGRVDILVASQADGSVRVFENITAFQGR